MAFTSHPGKPEYLPLDSDESFHEQESSPDHDRCQVCHRKTSSIFARSGINPAVFWAFTTFFLLFVLSAIIIFEITLRNTLLRYSYSRNFPTELSSAKSEISLRQVPFTGNINFLENGTTYLEREPGSKVYVGKPTDEIDRNWEDLLQNRYFYLTEAEVVDSWGQAGLEEFFYEMSPDDERKYVGGLDTLHTLHCLDGLRQTLDRDHYPKARKPGSLHLYHCIDHLRQWIMCSGDFTPIPVRWHPEKGTSYVDTDQVHTCRNFDALWSWVQKREPAFRH